MKFFMLMTLLVLISFPVLADARTAWDLNDVSYIFPLPNPSLLSASIRPTDLDGQGRALLPLKTLLPIAQANDADHLLLDGDILPRSPEFNQYRDLFVVALRIDPCFKDHFTDTCQKQIRAVWQPVDHWREGKAKSVDAALHTFYRLSDDDFENLLTGLQNLKQAYEIQTLGTPLGVHPGFSVIAPTPFQLALRDFLLPFISSEKISRIAFMKLRGYSISWDFHSVDFLGESRIPIIIFPGDHDGQSAINIDGMDALKDFHFPDSAKDEIAKAMLSGALYQSKTPGFMGLDPSVPEEGDQLLSVMQNSALALNTPARAKAVLQKALRTEDPTQNLPGTTDCVSCHIATASKQLAIRAGAMLPHPTALGSYNLKNNSVYYGDTHQLRMLGYISNQVQIADRSINETAQVAEMLNHLKK